MVPHQLAPCWAHLLIPVGFAAAGRLAVPHLSYMIYEDPCGEKSGFHFGPVFHIEIVPHAAVPGQSVSDSKPPVTLG